MNALIADSVALYQAGQGNETLNALIADRVAPDQTVLMPNCKWNNAHFCRAKLINPFMLSI
ncbi:hypothetical protein DPMN_189375 [Dreissena polymorpha]|uniref:Uncharacterized protein n=1 Tax=Dreissena polymorpha TaxID=45954 RepID=A0A9D4DSE5_DREPO|nr:hypothetical protein DPMN_189375 [Dreissena polymorpha]